MTKFFLFFLIPLLAAFAPPQDPPWAKTVATSALLAPDTVLALHDDGSATLAKLTEDGWVTSRGDEEPSKTEVGDLQKLSTKWKDRNGAEHVVETPVPSQTPAMKAKAIEAHLQMVETMQRAFPPAPNP